MDGDEPGVAAKVRCRAKITRIVEIRPVEVPPHPVLPKQHLPHSGSKEYQACGQESASVPAIEATVDLEVKDGCKGIIRGVHFDNIRGKEGQPSAWDLLLKSARANNPGFGSDWPSSDEEYVGYLKWVQETEKVVIAELDANWKKLGWRHLQANVRFVETKEPGSADEKPPSFLREATGCLVWPGSLLLAFVWAFYALYWAPGTKLTSPDARIEADVFVTRIRLAGSLGLEPSDIRVEALSAGNLDVYLTRNAFESAPYPDREDFVRNHSRSWCKDNDSFFMPSVRFRDIRTGKVMASCNCWRFLSETQPVETPTNPWRR